MKNNNEYLDVYDLEQLEIELIEYRINEINQRKICCEIQYLEDNI